MHHPDLMTEKVPGGNVPSRLWGSDTRGKATEYSAWPREGVRASMGTRPVSDSDA